MTLDFVCLGSAVFMCCSSLREIAKAKFTLVFQTRGVETHCTLPYSYGVKV